MKGKFLSLLFLVAGQASSAWTVAPTGQSACYDAWGRQLNCAGTGQDAEQARAPLRYRDHGDGTLSDLHTGLMWQKATGPKLTWAAAKAGAAALRLGGQSDWRLPNIKELYSLMDFSGRTPMPPGSLGGKAEGKPFIDTSYFEFRYGDPSQGERPIDAQYWSATEYTGLTMGGSATVFGVNFADGRIKGYPKARPRQGENKMFVRYVRGQAGYGENEFVDNRDGTVTDKATGLMWMQGDSGESGESGESRGGPYQDGRMNWSQALAWAAQSRHAGHGNWRLPNAKELQSLVDYRRSPARTDSPALSPLFRATAIRDEKGGQGYGSYWSSTSHLDGPQPGEAAVYVAFGEALGYMRFPSATELLDVHGAGAQRSDPKEGDPARFPQGRGPQGDVIRIYHLVRLVRDAR